MRIAHSLMNPGKTLQPGKHEMPSEPSVSWCKPNGTCDCSSTSSKGSASSCHRLEVKDISAAREDKISPMP